MVTKEIAMPPIEEENNETIEQAPQQEPVEDKESTIEQEVAETEKEAGEAKKETSKEINLRILREKNEKLELEHQRALLKLKEYEERSNKKPEEEEDLEINLSDDDLFEGKHYKKLQKQLKKQQEALKKYESQVQLTTTEAKLKSQYSDFDKVVNEKTILALKETEPEIAESIASTQDIYSKAVAAYKMIKKLGIYVEDSYSQDRELARTNSLKPKSAVAASPQRSDSPLTKANAFANGLTPELKRQLWREMNEASKNSQ